MNFWDVRWSLPFFLFFRGRFSRISFRHFCDDLKISWFLFDLSLSLLKSRWVSSFFSPHKNLVLDVNVKNLKLKSYSK